MSAAITSLLSRSLATSPLRHPRYRLFYIGSIATAFGYTMQTTIAAWLMATLTPSALMVALVQTASMAPGLAFGLVAGTLADIIDRRTVVMFTQVTLLAATLALGLATIAGAIGPVSLLLLTFLVGIGFTFYMPAQQALINDLVPREDLPPAVALSAVAFNVARAAGPALAGALAAWLGSGSAFLASALFFVLMLVTLGRVSVTAAAIPGVPETLMSGVRSGLRYLRHSPALLGLITHSLSFSVCASALWALLPVIARDQLGLGAGGFGILFGAFGAGAVAGALWLPRQIRSTPLGTVVRRGNLVWCAATLTVAGAPVFIVAFAGAAAAGAAWVTVLAGVTAGTQSTAPGWVRARAVAANLVAIQAGLALGSALWGALASSTGTRIAVAASAAAVLGLLVLTRRIHLELGEEGDVTTGVPMPEFTHTVEPLPNDGPVLIQVEYVVAEENRDAFLEAVYAIEPTRRRNGASYWRLYRDLENDGHFIERFVVTSWAEYIRLRNRTTVSERKLQVKVRALQSPDVPIRISRLIGVGPPA
ncbi:MAG: MFS transporter [Gammaproteobacteria bacterium]